MSFQKVLSHSSNKHLEPWHPPALRQSCHRCHSLESGRVQYGFFLLRGEGTSDSGVSWVEKLTVSWLTEISTPSNCLMKNGRMQQSCLWIPWTNPVACGTCDTCQNLGWWKKMLVKMLLNICILRSVYLYPHWLVHGLMLSTFPPFWIHVIPDLYRYFAVWV